MPSTNGRELATSRYLSCFMPCFQMIRTPVWLRPTIFFEVVARSTSISITRHLLKLPPSAYRELREILCHKYALPERQRIEETRNKLERLVLKDDFHRLPELIGQIRVNLLKIKKDTQENVEEYLEIALKNAGLPYYSFVPK